MHIIWLLHKIKIFPSQKSLEDSLRNLAQIRSRVHRIVLLPALKPGEGKQLQPEKLEANQRTIVALWFHKGKFSKFHLVGLWLYPSRSNRTLPIRAYWFWKDRNGPLRENLHNRQSSKAQPILDCWQRGSIYGCLRRGTSLQIWGCENYR